MVSRMTLQLARFLAWWGAELRALMPARLRTRATAANMLLLDVGRQTVRVVDEAQIPDEAEEHEPLAEWPRAEPGAAPPAAIHLYALRPFFQTGDASVRLRGTPPSRKDTGRSRRKSLLIPPSDSSASFSPHNVFYSEQPRQVPKLRFGHFEGNGADTAC